jgi:hypothetical protein
MSWPSTCAGCDGVQRAESGVPNVSGLDDGCDVALGEDRMSRLVAFEADESRKEMCGERSASSGGDEGALR